MAASAASSLGVAVGVSRTIELLAPVYDEVCQHPSGGATNVPVMLQRTADDWIRLVFAGPNVRKDVVCVNGASGCRCDFVRFLRALLVLMERQIVVMDATYATTPRVIGQKRVATLQLRVRVHDDAQRGTSLKDFDFVLCHLQATVLTIVARNEQAKKEALNAALEAAKNTSCHVVGCKLHPWDKAIQPKQKLNLPDVFHSLTSQMEVDQMEIRDDATYVARMTRLNKQVVMTDLPTNVLQNIVCLMNARGLASLSGVCSLFQHMAYEVVPGLNLVLYEHQRRGLKWMLRRETRTLSCIPQPHPFILSSESNSVSATAIDLIEDRVISHPHETARDACGGMFCDEPGLGKTITMLALILRTKGQSTDNTPVDYGASTARPGLRSSRSRRRSVNAEDLVSSGASLIVAPDPLVEHWKYQVEAHVAPGALRIFVDPGVEFKLPFNFDLAEYDVVITSFTRLAREWRLHRPTSALEARMPERYGFEGPQRYADGTLRGNVSSLLTVHWLRVIVDEGHKLGGQTPSDLMQLARLICAERRWVMTGTPTPNTLQSADLRYMYGLLVFLRNRPYGNPDGQAWVKAIARPFERNDIVGFYRLQHLLSRIMMRHTKESIREILPEPTRRTVFIDPTPSEYSQYNGIAAAVRANLVITNMDPKTPGHQHPDSLLNPVNRKEALRVVSNLRAACCGGSAVKVSLADSSRLDTINMLNALSVDGENMGTVIDYLRKVQLQGMVTQCGCCKRKLQLLMIIPCGHLCCADCVEDRMERVGPICFRCNAVFDREAFQRLQPGFEFELVEAVTLEANDPDRDQEANGQIARRQPRRAMDYTRDIHFIDASKAFYAATRIKELKEEFLQRNMNPSSRSSRRQARNLKAIIFSQFKDHIWHTKVAFAQQGLHTADFIAGLSPEIRMKQLTRFRKDPNVNVLLLTEVGSHGLDLSFVTHIFLMDEIWDKSLERQVISRAHRMGANHAVVVEQLWMRGSVESHMLKPHESSDENQIELEEKPKVLASSTRTRAQLGESPGRSPKKTNTGGGKMFNAPSKKRKRHRTEGDVRTAPKSNKNTILQRKLDYVLHKLRLLEESIVGEPGQVRFLVEDDQKNVVRQAIHVMPNRGSRGSTANTQLSTPTVATTTTPLSTVQTTARSRLQVRRVVTFGEEPMQLTSSDNPTPEHLSSNEIVVIDSSSGEENKEGDDGEEKEEDIEAVTMVQNSRWKQRRIVAALTSSGDDEGKPPAAIVVRDEVKATKTTMIVNSKAKAVSFRIIDDDDSETGSE
ncbi:Helicase conserved C-terminal domain [Phytophthora infestans]|uniref:Helicase conserved C-terminal domain n=1 Tax=Phytophthora infestans TaxID=4787 RepID=A0A833SUH1_PHYIN|nr:Helicase conserved C-terminal domain [Phytophthora infestans]KAF4143592.1 Helicase conserved C-terminal domain [Phytophthora infestans]